MMHEAPICSSGSCRDIRNTEKSANGILAENISRTMPRHVRSQIKWHWQAEVYIHTSKLRVRHRNSRFLCFYNKIYDTRIENI